MRKNRRPRRMKKYEIGGIFFDTPYFMAPLAGITDSPFRRLCRKFGGRRSIRDDQRKGMYYNDKITEKLLTIREEEMPVVYQIFGSDPETMAYAADALSSKKLYDRYQYGLSRAENRKKAGMALRKDPEKVSKNRLSDSPRGKKPVTVKIRAGWNVRISRAESRVWSKRRYWFRRVRLVQDLRYRRYRRR